jgi:hypothetical protein
LKLIILALLAGNILLVGLEASKPTAGRSPSVEAEPASPVELPEIRLLSEIPVMESVRLTRQCFTVGPFEASPTADAIVEMLREHATRVSPRETEAFVDRGYWVYMPAYPDEMRARQAVKSLYGAGLEDVSLIKEGEWHNSVSLGYFISQSNAMKHRDRVRKLGFEAQFRIQRDDESRFWVDYEQQMGVEDASRVLSGLVPAELHRPTACPENQPSTEAEPAASEMV